MTATLRNLVDSPLARMKLLSTSALPQLCTVIEQYMSDKDVCTNVARIFRWVPSLSKGPVLTFRVIRNVCGGDWQGILYLKFEGFSFTWLKRWIEWPVFKIKH